MRFTRAAVLAGVCGLSLFLAAGCSGGGSGGSATNVGGENGGTARLLRMDFGRVVDVYSFDASSQDPNRQEEVLYRRDVVIGQSVISGELNETDYILREPDTKTGRAQLVIKRDRNEKWGLGGGAGLIMDFAEAIKDVEVQVTKVAPGIYSQNVSTLPFDVVPRNSAIKLTFESNLNLAENFFLANPNAIQVLEICDDPDTASAAKAFKVLPARFSVFENTIVIDPVIIGEEYKEQPGLQPNPTGLPESPNSIGSNIRIAIPVNDVSKFPIKSIGDVNPLGIDRKGQESVIRDFRSGNHEESFNGFMVDNERPYLIGSFEFGILAVNTAKNTITINKRAQMVTLRSRNNSAGGRPGDMIIQEVKCPTSGETVRIKAEIDDPTLNDSGTNAVVTVKVNQLYGYDSKGNQVWFQPVPYPVPRNGSGQVIGTTYTSSTPLGDNFESKVIFEGEKDDPSLFLEFSPPTSLANPMENVDPFASVGINFSEPVSKGTLDQYDTIMLATTSQLTTLKKNKLGRQAMIVSTLVLDPTSGMSARMVPPIGFNHENGTEENYYLVLLAEDKGEQVTDLAGNCLDLRDSTQEYLAAGFKLDKTAADNLVGNIIYTFGSPDENGTTENGRWGNPIFDANGQYTMHDGRLYGAQPVRFPKYVEESTLKNVIRGNKGDCHDDKGKQAPSPYLLYMVPRNIIQTQAGPTGGTQEPLNVQGSRLMVTWREDDLGLSHTDLSQMELDIEQLYWSSWMGNQIQYDVFDRVSLALSHSEKRPDIPSMVSKGKCQMNGAGLASGLSVTFADNVLDNTQQVTVYEDVVYQLNPNNSFLNSSGERYLPYPEFQTTYTWRDRRLTSWDTVNDMATGLGGAQDPENTDFTTDVISPWFDQDPAATTLPLQNYTIANDTATNHFLGSVIDGLSPLALPLLMDFKTYPDDPNRNGGLAKGLNLQFIGHVWALWPGGMIPHGYYLNPGGAAGLNRPFMRVHATGGTDSSNKTHIVDPKNTFTANGGWLVDRALGLHNAPPGDCHVQWGRADFLRRISVITYGFHDTTRVNKHKINGAPNNGSPVWDPAQYRPVNFEVVTDPPLDQMPNGTMANIEWRGVETLPNDDVYHPSSKNDVWDRGNLLNPHYACDAYRLAAINGRKRYHWSYTSGDKVMEMVAAKGFTKYVQDPDSLVDSVTGEAPRYLNWRIVFTNNTSSKPMLSPYLDSFGVAIRLGKK